MRNVRILFLFIIAVSLIASCGRTKWNGSRPSQENLGAKKMLQGIWVDEDEQSVAFKAKGDTIFYPDSTSQPVYFRIVGDTLELHGANVVKYPIIKQAAHLFIFRNQNGDNVKCVKSDDPDDASAFNLFRPEALNQGKLVKRDTVVVYGNDRYHCYVQVNPTTYKVIRTSYNDDGVAVDNVYYDNIVNLNVYNGSRKLFGGDFHKQMFKLVPKDFLSQCILSDIVLKGCDKNGLLFDAILVMPDSKTSSWHVRVTVSYSGHMTMKIANK